MVGSDTTKIVPFLPSEKTRIKEMIYGKMDATKIIVFLPLEKTHKKQMNMIPFWPSEKTHKKEITYGTIGSDATFIKFLKLIN